jgi:hypothetical protein
MSTSAIWLSFDLGVRGDYESLYAWLDDQEAKECGDGIAFLNYEHTGALIPALTRELKRTLQLTSQTRIYVVFFDGKIRGRFVLGSRKAPPWSGYGSSETEADDES